MVFAVNRSGTFFGDIDFTLAEGEGEAKRAFSVKAKSNVELLTLQKQDLFNLDSEFSSEIKQLFEQSVENF